MADNTVKFRATMDDRVSGPLDRIKGKFDTLGKSKGFKSFAQGAGVGAGISAFSLLGSAVGAVGDFIGGSIKKASDLNESMSKSSVIFGNSAGAIDKWASTSSRAFGQSKREALDAASTFAGLFDTVGIEADKITPMAKKLTELGSDLASFFNTDVSEALIAVRSGLAGESEPLRRFNVFLSETAVKAKAMKMGLIGANGTLTEGQKVLARYQIILDQTGAAQGDFARTSDGLANSQKTATAALEDAEAKLGQKFLPVAKQVTNWQIDFIAGTEVLGKHVGGLSANVNNLAADFGDLLNPALASQKALLEADKAAIDLRKSEKDVGTAAKVMGKDVKISTGTTAEAFTALLSTAQSTAKGMVDGFFNPIQTRADIFASRQAVHAAAEERRNAKTKGDIRSTTTAIIDALDDQATGLIGLAEQGKLTQKDVALFKKDVVSSYKAMGKAIPPELQKIMDKLVALARLEGSTGIDIKVTGSGPAKGPAHKKKAKGGPVWPLETYTVGEEGPETLVMGTRGGSIIPNGAGGGGSSVTVNINSTFPPNPRDVPALVKTITLEMRRQHVL